MKSLHFISTLLSQYEEGDRLAWSCLPDLVVRGKELKEVEIKKPFNRKLNSLIEKDIEKKRQQDEFNTIMNRVREGKFLRSTKDLM